MKIPSDGSMLAINFKSVERLVPARITRGFKIRKRSIAETRQKKTGIISCLALLNRQAELLVETTRAVLLAPVEPG